MSNTIEIQAEVIPPTHQLDLAVQSAGVSETATHQLKSKFGGYFAAAESLINAARGITVTDATQLTEMRQARDARLALAKVRIEAEKTRKDMKEDSLRAGRAIDGIANVLKGMIIPVEDRLQDMEDFAKRAEAARKEALRAERAEILHGLGQETAHFDLSAMDAETFDNLVGGIRAANQARQEAERKAEEDRLAAIEREKAERAAQAAENARLKAEAEAREKEIAKERAKVEAERKAEAEKARKEAEALANIKLARAHVATMEAKHLEAKERAKDAKADWEAAVNHLTEVIDAEIKPMPLFDQKPKAVSQPTDVTNSEEADIANRWRAIPIEEICKGIKGMGAKKREALCEAIPTLGAFEDLRKKASLEGNPLREYMPKGIGQEACDQLEEAALNRISKEYGSDDDADDSGDDEADVDDDDTE
jgi:hypothetical protein